MKNPLMRSNRNRSLSPWRALSEIQNEMDRWFEGFRWPDELDTMSFIPACDLRDNNKEYILKLDVPGVQKEDIKIECDNNMITIRGERKREKEVDEEKRYVSESYYGSFVRTVTLPGPIDEENIDAQYRDGVLTITIPKSEVSSSRQIEVH